MKITLTLLVILFSTQSFAITRNQLRRMQGEDTQDTPREDENTPGQTYPSQEKKRDEGSSCYQDLDCSFNQFCRKLHDKFEGTCLNKR